MNVVLRDTPASWATLTDVLRWRALHEPEKHAYTFLLDGESHEQQWTYADLDAGARRIAALLQRHTTPGQHALLLYQPGLEYIAAVFGCLYAGVVAVPAYPPRLNHNLTRIEAILQDAQISFALTTSTILSSLRRTFAADPLMGKIRWLETDAVDVESAASWREWPVKKEHLALLQYTSGSTSAPKGVMLTHDHLFQNAGLIQKSVGLAPDLPIGSWLPPYHDMGLLGCILEAVYVGSPAFLMAPAAFLQQPMRWLQMMSRYRLGGSCAPNFAYDLCVQKAKPEHLTNLDLRAWKVAMSGAEPVRAETLERFAAKFAPYGFRKEAFYPCYGLAEATLFVSGSHARMALQVRTFATAALEAGQVVETSATQEDSRSLVGCGHAREEQRIIIVEPEQRIPCKADEVGEIWVAAPNVAQGYWGKELESEQTFRAYLQGSDDGPFLRTGDLGFLLQEELFVTGRLKDVIIIRGRNLYPQDIELIVEKSHPALRPGCCAAVSVTNEGREQLVIVQEVVRHVEQWDIQEIAHSMRQAVVSEFDVEIAALVLLRAGTIYKTSSGKIQRQTCRQSFLAGALEPLSVFSWHRKREGAQEAPDIHRGEVMDGVQSEGIEIERNTDDIITWLVTHIASHAQIAPEAVDVHGPFVQYGLGSLEAVGLSGELGQWLGRALSPTLVYDYPSIEALARYLSATDTEEAHAQTKATLAEPIAIIGMGCCFPGAANLDAFWQLLANGVDAIQDVPPDRWQRDALRTTDELFARIGRGGFVDRADQFDAHFFGLSAHEVTYMDPQQRVLLEVAWEALEHAGLVPGELAGTETGIFIGIGNNDYGRLLSREQTVDPLSNTGNSLSIAANRLSYLLDLKGPSVAVDTACSSALVAVHMACQSLRCGETNIALAGSVNLIFAPEVTLALTEAQMLAADGHCKTFDSRADGYVRSEGCGVLVLQRLSDAQRQGQRILAIIRGSAVNQNGRSNGLTAPNGLSQQAVIRQALHMAQVAPAQISYVEAHGTGTPLGDPIEVQALNAVLEEGRDSKETCMIGSVKTNLGHLEAAAGMVGMIKVVLSLQHQQIPPHLHFETINPHISLLQTCLRIPTTLSPWPTAAERRLAGVSSFGFGGTNAHVILEEGSSPPSARQEDVSSSLNVLVLSARTSSALETVTSQLADYLQQRPEINLADVAATLQSGRTHFRHRRFLVSETREAAIAALTTSAAGALFSGLQETSAPHVAFMFPGIGSQYVGMAADLYHTEPVFRRSVDQCVTLLQPRMELDLRSLLYPSREQEAYAQEQLVRPSIGYPALFVISYSYALLWMSWGIMPDAMIGHSMGEYVAACLAGVLSLDDALAAVAVRARLFETLPDGAMLSVALSAEQVQPLLGTQLSLAAINSPSLSVVSGPVEDIERLATQLYELHIETWRVHIAMAAHSLLVEPMLEDFSLFLQMLTFHAPTIPYISNVTGNWVTEVEATDPHYWIKHTRQTVLFAAGLQAVVQKLHPVLLEVGPGQSLSTFAKRGHESIASCPVFSSLPHRREDRSAHEFALQTMGRLWLSGVKIAWRTLSAHAEKRPQLIALPTYPFERQRYPLPFQQKRQAEPAEMVTKSEKPVDISDWFYAPVWKRQESYAATHVQKRTQKVYSWLVFIDPAHSIGDILLRLLVEDGHDIIVVRPADHFSQLDERSYTLHPQRRADYNTLIQVLNEQERLPQKIVHAWAIMLDLAVTDTPFQRFEHAQALGFYSVLFLTQALAAVPGTATRELIIAFSAAHVVTGDETIYAELATIMGICRVIPCTYTHITCRGIDVVVPTAPSQLQRLGAQLKRELLNETSETVVAYRGAARWTQTAEALPLPHQAIQDLPLRENGIYVITGGTGGIGLELGRSLAQAAQVTLILLQRSALPERTLWAERITREDDVARTLQTIQELETLGAEVVILQVDVADQEHMRIVLDEIVERFGAIHGVIHAAGVAGDNTDISTTTLADVQRMLVPKAYGALVLQSLLAERELDFLVFCSSLSAFFSASTSVSYSAANNFLDAFAQSMTASAQTTQLTLSIDWDVWGEVGMAARALRQEMATREVAPTLRRGQNMILPGEGREAFLRLLGSGHSQVFVTARSVQDHAEWDMSLKQASSPIDEQVSTTSSVSASRPELATPYVAPVTSTERALASIWQDVLGFVPLGIDDNFFALGGDSILGIQIMARARQAGIEISPQQLFQHQTIAQLAAHVVSAPSYKQGEVTGEVVLLPMQQHFFAQQLTQPHHYNQALLLQIPARWSFSQLRHVVVELLRHHDAWRLRFMRTEHGWQQRFLSVADAGSVEIEHVDIREVPDQQLSDVIEAVANRVQTSLDIEHGPLVRLAFFEREAGVPARLLLVIHRLAMDELSWRILLDDMQLALHQLGRGESIQLPAKTLSLPDWAVYVRQLTQEAWLSQEVSYWQTVSQTSTSALPVDLPAGNNTYASARQIHRVLTLEETRHLCDDALKSSHSQMQELLLVPLLQVLMRWIGTEQIRIELEGNVRKDVAEMVPDVSRTIGWFTYPYPALFTLPQQPMETMAWIHVIKEQLHAIPHKGVGYGLLCYPGDQGDQAVVLQGQAVEVAFTYRDLLIDASPAGDTLLEVASEASGSACGLDNRREHLLEVSGRMLARQLHVSWTYSGQLHRRETIEALADEYIALLRSLLAHCLAPGAVERTTSADFPLAHLTSTQLERVFLKHPLIEDLYPLTPLQQGMLFHTLHEPNSGAYVEQVTCTFSDLSQELFVEAWKLVIAQQTILRTAFAWQDGEEPLQLVMSQVDLSITALDWRERGAEQQQRDLEVFKQEDRRRGFDLQQAPLMRLAFFRLDETRTLVLWSYHQILLDGWSIEQLMQDIFLSYVALMQVQVPQLQPRRAYRDYLAWLEERSRGEDEAYWQHYLAGFHVPTRLAVVRGTSEASNQQTSAHAYGSALLTIPSATNSRWQMAARQYQVTLNTLVQGAWALLLSRYSGQQDVLFGAVSSGRPPQLVGMEYMIGLFINTLPVRVKVEEEQSIKSWLLQLQEQQVAHRQYEHCALVQIQGWSEVPRDLPLFESVLVFENYPIEAGLRDQGRFLNIEAVEIDSQTNYPLTLFVVIEDELQFRVNYDQQHFDEATIQRLLAHLQTVLEQFIAQPDLALSTVSLVSAWERQQLLAPRRTLGSAPVHDPTERIHTLFETQAGTTPDAIAIVWDEQLLTYAELNRRANQFAHYLQAQGVGPEVRVGVLLARSLQIPIVLLGILKAGGAYVPLDPALPSARLSMLAQDSLLSLLVTGSEPWSVHKEHVGTVVKNILLLEHVGQQFSPEHDDNLATLVAESNLSYIVYTSGSTGRPKGVLSTHAGVVNYLRSTIQAYHLTSELTVLQIPPLSFDASVRDIFAPLSIGARLVLMKEHQSKDLNAVLTLLRQQQVSALLSVVPSFLHTLLETADAQHQSYPSVQLLLTSGERLSLEVVDHARRVFAGQLQVINQYGPTETTMTCTYFRVEPTAAERGFALIGRPLEQMQAYLLDPHLNLVPFGVAGEVYLSGIGLARGYMGLADMTAERFVPDPFSSRSGARMYRTGDLARYRADDVLEYIGRLDQQVKIRGNRVEPGEIAASLEAYPGVGQAIVIARAEISALDVEILAYIVPEQGVKPELKELRSFLQARLPEYMLPRQMMLLETLPLTPHGKVDRLALPAPAQEEPLVIAEEALTPLQAHVASIWAEMLHRPQVGLHDDFFELGGHSLLAFQLINRIRMTFEVELPLDSLFETPTVAEMALCIDEIRNEALEQTEDSRLVQLLDSVEGLSEDEIDRILSAEE